MRSGWLARSHSVIDLQTLDSLDTDQLRTAVRAPAKEVHFKQATIDKLTHENAVLKRLKFAAQSEAYTGEQKRLLEETLDMDLAPWRPRSKHCGQPPSQARRRAPSGRHRLRTCRAASSGTSPRAPPADAARR
jgi:hypothetical protein